MQTPSITRGALARANVSNWAWWQVPPALRFYVAAVPAIAFALMGFAASQTAWHLDGLLKFLLFLTCGLISVAATPRMAYLQSGSVKDFITAWVLPVAVLLPPVYALILPVPLFALTQWRAPTGFFYRRVFSAAAIGISYSVGALVFRAFPGSFAGGGIGFGTHALTWAVAVVVCELIGGTGHRFLILMGIKLSDPSVRLFKAELNREALLGAFAEFDLGVLITLVVATNPLLAVFAVPTVLLARRFMMHAPLVEQSRLDTKTGLLNASTWEREATVEVERAVRTHTPLAVALVDIDHFKLVNDTYGHLVGDRVLRAVTDALRGQLRGYDLAGRFGGEEFIILLPQANETAARNVAERLRTHVAAMAIPIDDERDCLTFVRLTISVGVAALDGVSRELTDLMAAADAAMYYAKETGRNKTHVITASAGQAS
jgi:diguanylate cyclase (GGDEF)-like protein